MACIRVCGNVMLNRGHIKIINTNAYDSPTIAFDDRYESSFVTQYKDTGIYLETNVSDVHLQLDINSVQTSYVQIATGTIKTEAVASKKNKNHIEVGAIALNINKDEIGSLYMRVYEGMIIADSPIQVMLHKTKGYEAYFQGALQHQHTVLIVKSGAIICRIYNPVEGISYI